MSYVMYEVKSVRPSKLTLSRIVTKCQVSLFQVMVIVLAIIAAVLQVTVFTEVNILVVLAVFSGLKKGPWRGALISGLIGIIAEIFSSSVFGLHIALYTMVGLFSGMVSRSVIYREDILVKFIFSFFGVLLFYLSYCFIAHTDCSSVLSVTLFSAGVSPIIFRIAER